MKRLLALLLLAVPPAFAQELPPIYSPTVEQTYTPSTTTTTSLQNVNQTGGTALTLYDDGTTFTPIEMPFDFYYFGSLFDSVYISQNGFISFTSNANGCCSGNQLPFISDQAYYNVNNSIFAMWSDLADFNTPGNPYYKFDNNMFTVGWYGVDELGSANKFTFEINLFSDSSFNIVYGDFNYTMPTGRMITSGFQGDTSNEFYTIYYGNDPTILENNTYTFTSSAIVPPPPPPPQFLYWNRIAGEYETFTLTEQAVVRYGADGVYSYQTLEPGTYDCGNSIFGDPIGGVVKSCQIGTNEPPPLVADCSTNPLDPTCIIDSIIDEEPVLVADTTMNSMPADEEEPVPEELLAVEESFAAEETSEEESLEELLAEEDDDVIEEKLVAVAAETKELANEEKAEALSDSISKDVLESALSIAADATSSGSSSSTSTESSSSSSSSTRQTSVSGASESTADNSSTVTVSAAEVNQDLSGSSESAAMELLETGRQIGQEALASTMAATEASASDSLSQAEGIASISAAESFSASSTADTINSIQIENVIEITTTDTAVESITEIVMADNTNTDTNSTTTESAEFNFVDNNPSAVAAQEAESEAIALVNNVIAASEQKTFDDESNKDAETTTALIDPALALANTFNQPPSLMNLEILGIVKPVEEKSDAEIRAEQVVAANKEQQDAINANYMDADQSGIVAAIGAKADVSSYLSQRLQDVPFYKPEDIYKNIVIKDNVRGSYFLEKGNTDTYKKMVEEQYKDE